MKTIILLLVLLSTFASCKMPKSQAPLTVIEMTGGPYISNNNLSIDTPIEIKTVIDTNKVLTSPCGRTVSDTLTPIIERSEIKEISQSSDNGLIVTDSQLCRWYTIDTAINYTAYECKHIWVQEYIDHTEYYTPIVCIRCYKREQRIDHLNFDTPTPLNIDSLIKGGGSSIYLNVDPRGSVVPCTTVTGTDNTAALNAMIEAAKAVTDSVTYQRKKAITKTTPDLVKPN